MKTCDPSEPSRVIQYGLYPLLLLALLGYASLELGQPSDLIGRYYPYYLTALVVILLTIEILRPMRREWRMTKGSFVRRDLPFMLIGGLTLGLSNYAAGWAALHFGVVRSAAHADLPLLPAVILALLIPDFIWYWIHRLSHEGRSRFGQWLWTVHLTHHLPQQLYLLMHAVAHPLNAIVVRAIMTLPLFFLGFTAEVLFVANLIVGLQGFVSHFNVDVRAGWFNYFLMGTELHRNHHSADPGEAKNYGAVVTLWDQIFGTFYYRPGVAPERLGLQYPQRYPQDRDVWRVLALPFRRAPR